MAPPAAGEEVFVTETIVKKGVLKGYDDKGNARVKFKSGRGGATKVPVASISTDLCPAPAASGRGRFYAILAIGGTLLWGMVHSLGGKILDAIWPHIFPFFRVLGVS